MVRSLATGDSPDDMANNGGVSRDTVRAQLRQVLEKIGCTGQGESVGLLSNLSLGTRDEAELDASQQPTIYIDSVPSSVNDQLQATSAW